MSQPPPKKTDSPEVWPLVVADVTAGDVPRAQDCPPPMRRRLAQRMLQRHEFGRAKYGVSLQVENGRDPLADCMDEALDGCAYSRQLAMQSNDPFDWQTYHLFVALAVRLEGRGAP